MTNAIVPYVERSLTWEEQVEHIIAEIASGRSVSAILREDEGMPSDRTFWMRLYRDDELYEKISRARVFGVEAILEKALEIASTPIEGIEIEEGVTSTGPYRKVKRGDMLGHRRLMYDAMIRRAQMIQPRKYGAKVDITSDGEKISSIADAIAEGNRRIEESRK